MSEPGDDRVREAIALALGVAMSRVAACPGSRIDKFSIERVVAVAAVRNIKVQEVLEMLGHGKGED